MWRQALQAADRRKTAFWQEARTAGESKKEFLRRRGAKLAYAERMELTWGWMETFHAAYKH